MLLALVIHRKLWYLGCMYNWSVDEKKLQKQPKEYALWKLEQLINFGLNGEKINKHELREHWDRLHIDASRKNFLNLLLHGEKHPH